MIHSENGKIEWEGDAVILAAELTQLLVQMRKEEPEIFLTALFSVQERANEGKEKK